MSSKKFDCCSNEMDYILEEEELEENSEVDEESMYSTFSDKNVNDIDPEKLKLIELKKNISIIKREVKEIFKNFQQIDLDLENGCSLEFLKKKELEDILSNIKRIVDIDYNLAKQCK